MAIVQSGPKYFKDCNCSDKLNIGFGFLMIGPKAFVYKRHILYSTVNVLYGVLFLKNHMWAHLGLVMTGFSGSLYILVIGVELFVYL